MTKTITDCSNILEPLQRVTGDLESLNDWLDDAERLIESHQHSDGDFESQYHLHAVYFIFVLFLI